MYEVGGKTVVKCRDSDCETSVSAKSDRLRNHKMKCGLAKKNTPHKRSLDTNDIDENPITPTDEPATKKMKVHRAVYSYCTTTDAKTKVQLDEQIVNAFYACNIPISVISHP